MDRFGKRTSHIIDDFYERIRWIINDWKNLKGIAERDKCHSSEKRKRGSKLFRLSFLSNHSWKWRRMGILLAGTRTWESNYGSIRRWSSEIVEKRKCHEETIVGNLGSLKKTTKINELFTSLRLRERNSISFASIPV